MLAVALNEIRRGAGKNAKIIEPGTVIDIPESEFKELGKLRAVREPNEAETALFNQSKPKLSAKKAAPAKSGAKSGAKADEDSKSGSEAGSDGKSDDDAKSGGSKADDLVS
jgi:hypothetical protein